MNNEWKIIIAAFVLTYLSCIVSYSWGRFSIVMDCKNYGMFLEGEFKSYCSKVEVTK